MPNQECTISMSLRISVPTKLAFKDDAPTEKADEVAQEVVDWIHGEIENGLLSVGKEAPAKLRAACRDSEVTVELEDWNVVE